MPRVVVTGIGAVSPIGVGRAAMWEAACAGRSGVGPITHFDPSAIAVKFACQVNDFEIADFVDRKRARRMDRFSHFAVAAAQLAVADAGYAVPANGARTGAIIGSGVGGLHVFVEQAEVVLTKGADRLSPFFIPMMVANMAAAQVSIDLHLRGPVVCVVSACASGNHAIGDAYDQIRLGRADAMLAGGVEAGITQMGVGAFAAMRALSTRNDDPEHASRPFDVGRDGFVMGEAGAVLMLERLDHAIERGAEPYCEVVGYGMSADAHHLTEPDPSGEAPALGIEMALREANLAPVDVDYINAHATSTPVGDPNELRAIVRAFGADVARRTPVSSTKSMHGHCLGGAGGVETGLTALAVREGVIPPTINLEAIDPECDVVDHVANVARPADVRVALSNAFGFGGHNATIVLARVEDDESSID